MKQPKLEQLLRMTVPVPEGCVAPAGTPTSPEFRIAIQKIIDDGPITGVHIIVHPNGYNGDTLDFVVVGDQLMTLEKYDRLNRLLPLTTNA